MKATRGLSLIVLTQALLACSGGGGSSNQPGTLSLGITDGPVEQASAVVVAFTAVEIHGAESKLIEFDAAKTINLLDYQGEERVLLLDEESLAAGEYQWLRLSVDETDSYIEVDGMRYPLVIPSGAQSGLKLNRGFTIGAGSSNDFTIDFDLRKSVHQEGTGDYKLRPTVRIENNLLVNTVEGSVAADLVTDPDCNNGDNHDIGNAVYLFSGAGATVQDLQGNDLDPLTTASVSYEPDSETYVFTIGYVPHGTYTLAFTCDAVDDIALQDDSLLVSFSDAVNLEVDADPVPPVVLD